MNLADMRRRVQVTYDIAIEYDDDGDVWLTKKLPDGDLVFLIIADDRAAVAEALRRDQPREGE